MMRALMGLIKKCEEPSQNSAAMLRYFARRRTYVLRCLFSNPKQTH